jgi:cysteine-rich repeat protein
MVENKNYVLFLIISAIFGLLLLGAVSACYCGDGAVNQANESCDDGNTNNNDGCSSICKTEFCGDGIIQSWEQCDGSNLGTATCASVMGAGYTGTLSCDMLNKYLNNYCAFDTSECHIPQPVCGNGIIELGEQCDNSIFNGALCWAGYGHSCSYCTASCKNKIITNYCGDGIKQECEQCDDGNQINTDSCSNLCKINNPEPPTPVCGNHITEAGEQCDDGNLINGDGCSSTCQLEQNPPQPPVCGDTQCNGLETCSTCSIDCGVCPPQNPVCGNGIIETGETCDDSNLINGDGCSSSCIIENNDNCDENTVVNLNHFVQFCNVNWKCSAWSECIDGMMTRKCIDKNNCDIEYNKPYEQINCNQGITSNAHVETDNTNYFWIILGIIIFVALLIILINLLK